MRRGLWILLFVLLLLGVTYCASKKDRLTPEANQPQRQAAPKVDQKEMQDDANAKLLGAPRYPRPASDPSIVEMPGFPSIKLVDTKTGDFFVIQTADRERGILYFILRTKDEKYVCTFETKFGPGNYGKGAWPAYPVRVFDVRESKAHTAETLAARKRMSIERFAQFLTVLPRFNGTIGTDFVVIDAPAQPGEQL